MKVLPKELQPIETQTAREDKTTRRFLLKIVDDLFNEKALTSPAFSMRGLSSYMHGATNWTQRMLSALAIDPKTKKPTLSRNEMADILADQLSVTDFNLLRRYAKGLEKANRSMLAKAKREAKKKAKLAREKEAEVHDVRDKLIKATQTNTNNSLAPVSDSIEERLRTLENGDSTSAPIITTKVLDDWLEQATYDGHLSAQLFKEAASSDESLKDLMASIMRSITIAKNSLSQNGQNIGRIIPLAQSVKEDNITKYDDYLYGNSRNGNRLYYLRILAMLLVKEGK